MSSRGTRPRKRLPDEKGIETSSRGSGVLYGNLLERDSPMRRGLKLDVLFFYMGGQDPRKRLPDEKGIETQLLRTGSNVLLGLERDSPMRRGLKLNTSLVGTFAVYMTRKRLPDEKGIETNNTAITSASIAPRKRLPDEKGIETYRIRLYLRSMGNSQETPR